MEDILVGLREVISFGGRGRGRGRKNEEMYVPLLSG